MLRTSQSHAEPPTVTIFSCRLPPSRTLVLFNSMIPPSKKIIKKPTSSRKARTCPAVTVPLQAHQSGHSSCPSSPPARSMDTSSLDSASTSMPLALSSHPLIPAAKARRKESASGSSSGWSNDTVPAVICFIWGAQGRWGGSESTELRVAAAESVLDYTWVGILG